jgi:Nucleotidyltransferase domain.
MSGKPDIAISDAEWHIVRDILNKHISGYPVWAFGSRVRCTHKPFSDLDIVVGGEMRATAKKTMKPLTHKQMVSKMLKKPAVKAEVNKLNREELAILDEILAAREEAGLSQAPP